MSSESSVEERVITAASQLLGCESHAGAWTTIKSDERSIVLRGQGVVAKQGLDGHVSSAVHEIEMLRYLDREFPGLAPAVVASDVSRALVLIEDLGAGDSLADLLLGRDPMAARRAMEHFVDALARLHNITSGVNEEGLPASDWLTGLSSRAIGSLSKESTSLPLLNRSALAEALGLVDRLGPQGPRRVLSFGDMCPDNNVFTSSGLRLIDLEAAGRVHPAVDVAYLTMPFPSCWCSFDLPTQVRDAMLNRYRTTVVDPMGVDDLHLAQAFFAVVSAGAIGQSALEQGPVKHEGAMVKGLRLPTALTRLVHRLDRALEHPAIDDGLPALSSWMRTTRLHVVQRRPDVEPLALAPAFRAVP